MTLFMRTFIVIVAQGSGCVTMISQLIHESFHGPHSVFTSQKLCIYTVIILIFLLHPKQDLFTYLTELGVDIHQNEIVTNFPRRVLQDLDKSLTFVEANLYPSVTVFVQD